MNKGHKLAVSESQCPAPAPTPAVLRLLGIALCRTFYPDDPSASALLEQPTRWALDDNIMPLVTGILGLAIGTSAAASAGGGGSPRAGLTPRAGLAPGGGLTPRAQPAMMPRAQL